MKQQARRDAQDLLSGVAYKLDTLDTILMRDEPLTLEGGNLCGFCLILQDIRREVSEASEKIRN